MKSHARKLVALLLACLMLATIAACSSTSAPPAAGGGSAAPSAPSSSGGEPAAAKRDTLNVAVSLDGGTLDPLYLTGKGGYLSVLRTFCEPLWDYTLEGERYWVLATAYDRVSDINYTLKIREGVTFSNGNPLTAEDVLYTMQINHEDARAFLNVKAIDFEKTKVVDDYTIDVWYTAFNAGQEPGIPQMGIVDKESYDPKEMAIRPVGTGAYVVKEYVVNSHVIVERRDDYWGEKPYFKTIHFKCMSEEAQRVNALETGAVDFALIPMKDYDYIESLGTCTLQVLNTGSSLIAMYNMGKNSPLHSVEARRAVSYAINCQAIIDVAYSGKAELIDWPASESMTEMQDRYLNMDEIYSDRYNLEKAQALAEQSGLVGKTLRIVTNGDPKFVTAAEVIQNGLESLKVKSEIINYDQASYFSFLMSDNEYEIAIQTPVAPGSVTCDVFGNYPVFIPQDWSGPEREAYIALGAKANATADLAERQDVVYELLKLFNKHHLWYGLCEDPNLCAYNKDLKNVQIDNSGVWILQDMYF